MILIALDFETTGLQPANGAEIIEIGGYKLDTLTGEVATFQKFCKPSTKIPQFITHINGIDNNMVKLAKSFSAEWEAFCLWCGEFDYLVVHNASFETSFIGHYAKDSSVFQETSVIDTLAMARKRLDSSSNKLTVLCEQYNITLDNAHRALDDAIATMHLLVDVLLPTYKNPNTALKNNSKRIDDIYMRMLSNRNKRLEKQLYTERQKPVKQKPKAKNRFISKAIGYLLIGLAYLFYLFWVVSLFDEGISSWTFIIIGGILHFIGKFKVEDK